MPQHRDGPPPQGRPAPTDEPIEPLIAARWSPRAIAEDPVEPEKLRAVFEAARWAPSSFNEQPWRFLVATTRDPDWLARLRGYLLSGNAWATRAPVLVVSTYRTRFSGNDELNPVAFRDLGAAEQNLVLQAYAEGLVAHQMAGFERERFRDELVPDGFEVGSMTALGYPGDPEDLDEKLRAGELSPRQRKSLDDLVFGAEWGEPAELG
ncbi:MAG: nitroreductase family protein [Gemmatimonadota bacterium]|nr:nitroreductase family protein [Gemmatimonadota bacterium]